MFSIVHILFYVKLLIFDNNKSFMMTIILAFISLFFSNCLLANEDVEMNEPWKLRLLSLLIIPL